MKKPGILHALFSETLRKHLTVRNRLFLKNVWIDSNLALISWDASIFSTEIFEVVLQKNGLCSHYFKTECGVGQGDQLSSCLLVTAIEILVTVIWNQDVIKGMEINDLETKRLQFADDKTVVLLDLDSAPALPVLLDCFEKVSRLKLNVAKQKQLWIGFLRNCENEPLTVKWKTCISYLELM